MACCVGHTSIDTYILSDVIFFVSELNNLIVLSWTESITSAEDKENAENLEDNSDACDIEVIAGLVETIAICWGGIKDKLDQVQ